MANRPFRQAYEAAATELESLLKDQERIEERILSLRKTMNALAVLISQHEGRDKDFMDYAGARLRDMVDSSVTHDISRIINASADPLTASEIRTELNELGGSLAEQSNPLATIHAVLNRLAESGRAQETLKNGKKAWCRVERSTNSLADIFKSPEMQEKLQAAIGRNPRGRTVPPPPGANGLPNPFGRSLGEMLKEPKKK